MNLVDCLMVDRSCNVVVVHVGAGGKGGAQLQSAAAVFVSVAQRVLRHPAGKQLAGEFFPSDFDEIAPRRKWVSVRELYT